MKHFVSRFLQNLALFFHVCFQLRDGVLLSPVNFFFAFFAFIDCAVTLSLCLVMV